MDFFDILGMSIGYKVFDKHWKKKEREREKQEFVRELIQNAAREGLTYSDEEIQEILADSERLGLFG